MHSFHIVLVCIIGRIMDVLDYMTKQKPFAQLGIWELKLSAHEGSRIKQ